MQEAGRRRLTVVGREQLMVEGTDFRAEVTRTLRLRPTVHVIHMGEDSLAALLKEIRQQGFTGEIYTTHVFEGLLKKLPPATINNAVNYTFPSETDQRTHDFQDFSRAFRTKFGAPPAATAPYAFDALTWIAEAYRTCGRDNLRCVKERFRNVTLQGVGGELRLDDLGRSLRPFGLKRYESFTGRWIEPRLPWPSSPVG